MFKFVTAKVLNKKGKEYCSVTKKTTAQSDASGCYINTICDLLFLTTVTAHELINATGSIHKFLFTCEEGVRCASDFKFY